MTSSDTQPTYSENTISTNLDVSPFELKKIMTDTIKKYSDTFYEKCYGHFPFQPREVIMECGYDARRGQNLINITYNILKNETALNHVKKMYTKSISDIITFYDDMKKISTIEKDHFKDDEISCNLYPYMYYMYVKIKEFKATEDEINNTKIDEWFKSNLVSKS